MILRSFFHVFVPPDGQKIILTTQKHWESIRNGIFDLGKTYHDHQKRQRADFGRYAVLGGGVKKIPTRSSKLFYSNGKRLHLSISIIIAINIAIISEVAS